VSTDDVARAIRDAVGPATGTEKYARLVLGRLERDGLAVEGPDGWRLTDVN
jgi:hypothetical protein